MACASPDAGILVPAPGSTGAAEVRVTYQANVEGRSIIHGPGAAIGLGSGWVATADGMLRSREISPGVREDFALRGAGLGWWAWNAGQGAPADLGLAMGWTDSTFERRRSGMRELRSGERTLGFLLRASHRIQMVEPGLGLHWSSRFYKVRRTRLDYLAAVASLHLRLGPLPAGVFAEWGPWITNPDRLGVPWSAGVKIGPDHHPVLTIFATNTYGSALPAVLSAIPDTLWGLRLSVGWDLQSAAP